MNKNTKNYTEINLPLYFYRFKGNLFIGKYTKAMYILYKKTGTGYCGQNIL